MTGSHTHNQSRAGSAVNRETVTVGPGGAGPVSFSPQLVDKASGPKLPFGGNDAAELAFLSKLRVARRVTDGQPFKRKYRGEGA